MTILKLAPPYTGYNQIQNEMNRLFNNFLGWDSTIAGMRKYPLVNLYEENNNLFLTTELPGFTEKDIELNIETNNVRISGERKLPPEPEGGSYHRRERISGKFSKKIMLPSRISTTKASAKLANGVLLLTLPKAEEAKPCKIEVKVE